MKINESNYNLLKKASEITGVEDGVHWTDAENIEGYIEAENLYSTLQDMLYEYDVLKEKLEDTIEDRDENYQPIPFNPYDEYGISEDDFH